MKRFFIIIVFLFILTGIKQCFDENSRISEYKKFQYIEYLKKNNIIVDKEDIEVVRGEPGIATDPSYTMYLKNIVVIKSKLSHIGEKFAVNSFSEISEIEELDDYERDVNDLMINPYLVNEHIYDKSIGNDWKEIDKVIDEINLKYGKNTLYNFFIYDKHYKYSEDIACWYSRCFNINSKEDVQDIDDEILEKTYIENNNNEKKYIKNMKNGFDPKKQDVLQYIKDNKIHLVIEFSIKNFPDEEKKNIIRKEFYEKIEGKYNKEFLSIVNIERWVEIGGKK